MQTFHDALHFTSGNVRVYCEDIIRDNLENRVLLVMVVKLLFLKWHIDLQYIIIHIYIFLLYFIYKLALTWKYNVEYISFYRCVPFFKEIFVSFSKRWF